MFSSPKEFCNCPISSLDLDDGFAITKTDSGWQLNVFIACPALKITVDTEQYVMAEEKGSTVYKGKTASEPMLDRQLSENELSLLPNLTPCNVA